MLMMKNLRSNMPKDNPLNTKKYLYPYLKLNQIA